ncbi:MAG: cysteine desulfurase family protein [Eubacteriales bacterium]|nr:cysteine desulfurase family protein [Eubacteriales bacterium]
MKENIYFDCAATLPPCQQALDTFVKMSKDYFANASANHALGFEASDKLEKARAQIARYLSVKPEEVIFTSGASEGNNLVIRGVSEHDRSWAKQIITTKAEHPSVSVVFDTMEKEGFEVVRLDYDKEGKLDLAELEKALQAKKTSLVSVMAVNNEVGYIFPIKEVYDLCHKYGAVLHVDATQAIGKEPIDPNSYDLLTFSGHKIAGLKGSGALIKKSNVNLDPQIVGGSQEFHLRAGTTPLGLDCSLATALRITLETYPERRKNAVALNQLLRKGLKEIDEVVITSPETATPFILNFALTKHKGSVIAEALSNEGIYVSTKSACNAREKGYSSVLANAGYPIDIASNAIRLSFSGQETLAEGETFLSVLKNLLATIKERS